MKPQETLPLFDVRARKNDPLSSHAECQRQNKKLAESMQYALRWIRYYPGHTAKEIEDLVGCPAGRIWKVAAQLERRGLIERRRDGSKPYKLYPVNEGNSHVV